MALETPARIAPCGIEEFNPVELTDLFFEIRLVAEAPGSKLHPASAAELRGMTRICSIARSGCLPTCLRTQSRWGQALAPEEEPIRNGGTQALFCGVQPRSAEPPQGSNGWRQVFQPVDLVTRGAARSASAVIS